MEIYITCLQLNPKILFERLIYSPIVRTSKIRQKIVIQRRHRELTRQEYLDGLNGRDYKGPYHVALTIMKKSNESESDIETTRISNVDSSRSVITIGPEALNEPVTVEYKSPLKILANQEYFIALTLEQVKLFIINFTSYQ